MTMLSEEDQARAGGRQPRSKLSQLLYPETTPLDPNLDAAMTRVQGNISQLLANSGRPSVGDVGRSLLMSAAYRGQVPHTQFLQDQQRQQYEMVGAQANLVSQAVQMRLAQAKAKAGSNPMAAFFVKDLEEMIAKDPKGAERFMAKIEADPEPYSLQMHARIKAETASPGVPTKLTEDVGDQTLTAWYDDYGNPVPSPLTGNEGAGVAPRYKPTTTINNNMPAQAPAAPSGWMYTKMPQPGEPLELQKIPGGPIDDVMEAGRAQSLTEAVKDIDTALSIYMPGAKIDAETGEFTPGDVNRWNTFASDWSLWRSEGKRGSQAMERALDAAIKIRTGAGQSIPEAESYKRQFVPAFGDSDQAIIDKMQRLASFMRGTRQIAITGVVPDADPSLNNAPGGNGLPTLEDIDKMTEQQLDEFLKKNGR